MILLVWPLRCYSSLRYPPQGGTTLLVDHRIWGICFGYSGSSFQPTGTNCASRDQAVECHHQHRMTTIYLFRLRPFHDCAFDENTKFGVHYNPVFWFNNFEMFTWYFHVVCTLRHSQVKLTIIRNIKYRFNRLAQVYGCTKHQIPRQYDILELV